MGLLGRYEDEELDTQHLLDGDAKFIGWDARRAPDTLESGIVQRAQNTRFNQERAEARRGMAKITSISVDAPALTVPFTVGPLAIVGGGSAGGIFATFVYLNPTTGAETFILVSTDRAFRYILGGTAAPIVYPSLEVVASTDTLSLIQAGGYLYLYRGFSKRPLRWDGSASVWTALPTGTFPATSFQYIPNSGLSLFQQNRAILHTGRNTISVSNINNVEAYDSINGVFNFALGSNDYITGIHPYQDSQTLVFLRKSIWQINGIAGAVASMTTQLITTATGCVSNSTIATCGSDILFLSDTGVMRLQPGFELKLRGNSEPLSAPIQPFIDRINFSAIQAARAWYLNNRYYIAVPLDSATKNTCVLVYNFLNEQWESIDTYPGAFSIDSVVTATKGQKQTAFFLSQEGGLYAAEQGIYDEFSVSTNPVVLYEVSAEVRSRRFTFGNNNLKRFTRCTTNMTPGASDLITVTANLINPESSRTLYSLDAAGSPREVTRPCIIGRRGYAIEIGFLWKTHESTINNFNVEGFVAHRKTTTTT
jgi:hypothetical protein